MVALVVVLLKEKMSQYLRRAVVSTVADLVGFFSVPESCPAKNRMTQSCWFGMPPRAPLQTGGWNGEALHGKKRHKVRGECLRDASFRPNYLWVLVTSLPSNLNNNNKGMTEIHII